jgi:hypothetical protein
MDRKKDENEIAFDALQKVLNRDKKRDGLFVAPINEGGKIPYRVKAGRKGGEVGGLVRTEKLTPEQRSEIAKKAARARWGEKKKT